MLGRFMIGFGLSLVLIGGGVAITLASVIILHYSQQFAYNWGVSLVMSYVVGVIVYVLCLSIIAGFCMAFFDN